MQITSETNGTWAEITILDGSETLVGFVSRYERTGKWHCHKMGAGYQKLLPSRPNASFRTKKAALAWYGIV